MSKQSNYSVRTLLFSYKSWLWILLSENIIINYKEYNYKFCYTRHLNICYIHFSLLIQFITTELNLFGMKWGYLRCPFSSGCFSHCAQLSFCEPVVQRQWSHAWGLWFNPHPGSVVTDTQEKNTKMNNIKLWATW